MSVTLPWFVSPESIDVSIRAGWSTSLNVMCNGCGSWGLWSVWTTILGCRKVCPKCGGNNTERIGD